MMATAAALTTAPAQPALAVPKTFGAALDPQWLAGALASVSGGRAVTRVETVEVIKTVATKVRVAVTFEDDDAPQGFCLKGLLDVDEMAAKGGSTCVLEGDFYINLAAKLDVQVPEAVAVVTDRETQQSVLIMRDLIAGGGRFCSALEAFTPDEAAASLEQIARLHAGSALLKDTPWIRARAGELARMPHMTVDILQGLLDGPRGDNLTPAVRNGARLIEGMKALADRNAQRPQFLVHGDAHAGNIFRTAQGSGLIDWQVIQRGGWSIDVAYHLCAVLPVEIAAAEERRLLGEYLGRMRGFGFDMPPEEQAWLQYREAVVYGYYMWGITRRVDPPIIVQFTDRLGRAVMRHDSFVLLGVS